LNAAKPIMEEWTGQELMAVSLFGIRTYHRGSILTPHVDRLPLVASAISKLVGAPVKSPRKV
jgi:prolyl 4-hydroxylase